MSRNSPASQGQFDKVQSYIALGRAAGGTAHVLSALPTHPRMAKGLFAQPVLFTGLSDDSGLAREEIFGPVSWR